LHHEREWLFVASFSLSQASHGQARSSIAYQVVTTKTLERTDLTCSYRFGEMHDWIGRGHWIALAVENAQLWTA
jgi:hypothetical protein